MNLMNDEEYQNAVESEDALSKKRSVIGAIGDGLSGGGSFGHYFLKMAPPKSESLSDYADKVNRERSPEERQKKAMAYLENKRKMNQMESADDPASSDAESYRRQIYALSPSLQGKLEGMSLAQMERTSPILMAKIRGDQERETARIAAGARAQERRDKLDEKMEQLQTPLGLANTPDDAKQLKEAYEAKKSFDSKLQEMIDLRKKYGTEYLNREAVARGKQLSKDLLLEYKNMAKLGVLSQADTNIINAIIPDDPLAQDWAPGQDPILSNLEKFQQDQNRDFDTRVSTRTRSGIRSASNRSAPPPIDKKPSPVDEQAVQWARNNPQDPRSKEILIRNGIDPNTQVGKR